MDVFRGEHRIATASGPAVPTPEGPGLEVNHGPAGAAAEGDCWEGVTPDILPGDRVVVTDAAGATDSILVDDVSIDPEGPVDTDPTNALAPVRPGARRGDQRRAAGGGWHLGAQADGVPLVRPAPPEERGAG